MRSAKMATNSTMAERCQWTGLNSDWTQLTLDSTQTENVLNTTWKIKPKPNRDRTENSMENRSEAKNPKPLHPYYAPSTPKARQSQASPARQHQGWQCFPTFMRAHPYLRHSCYVTVKAECQQRCCVMYNNQFIWLLWKPASILVWM